MQDTVERNESSAGFTRRLSVLVCSQIHLLALAFVFEVLMLGLAILSLLFADLNTATRTVLYLDFVLLGIAIVPTGGAIFLCTRK